MIVVGAPGPAEALGSDRKGKSAHPYQFADAAAAAGTDDSTVWLVERTGYEHGKVPLSGVLQRAGPARVIWIDDGHTLAERLAEFPRGSIREMRAYSHGLPGLLALRYDWQDVPNAGLTTAEARKLNPDVFAPQAVISFDSCNTATLEHDESLAEAVVEGTQRPVEAWTGRTSYRDVNNPRASDKTVKASEVARGWRVDPREIGSRVLGRVPERVRIEAGSWTGTYEIDARLPKSREFLVPARGTVRLKIDARTEFIRAQGYAVFVVLHRRVGDSETEVGDSKRFSIGTAADFAWPDLGAGFYFLEIFSLNGIPISGSVAVDVGAPAPAPLTPEAAPRIQRQADPTSTPEETPELDAGSLRAEAARRLVRQLQEKKAVYGHETVTKKSPKGAVWEERREGWWWGETEFDCSKFVLWVLAGRQVGDTPPEKQDIRSVEAAPFGSVVDVSSVSAMLSVVDRLVKAGIAAPIRTESPAIGDLIFWTGHVGIVVEVRGQGADMAIVFAHMGGSGPRELGRSGKSYWLKVSELATRKELARGDFVGFWAP